MPEIAAIASGPCACCRRSNRAFPPFPRKTASGETYFGEAGLSLIDSGKLEWAESLATCTDYCTENTDVLLRSAKARASRGQTHQAIRLARTVAELASKGSGEETNRAFDLANLGELIFEFGDKDEARKYLEEAVKFAVASQEAHDIDGSKCLGAVAIAFAKHGYLELAREAAKKITQPARREYAVRKIEELSASK